MAGPRLERGSSCVGVGFGGCCVGGFAGEGEGLGDRFAEISKRGAVGGRGVLSDSPTGFGDTFPMVVFDSSPKDVSKVVSAREVVLL